MIDKQGVVYTDEEGDLVTSIVNHKDCVFTCYDERDIAIVLLRKPIEPERLIFINRFLAIFIPYASVIMVLIRL